MNFDAARVQQLLDYDSKTGLLYFKNKDRMGRRLLATKRPPSCRCGRVRLDGEFISSSKVVWAWHHGQWPEKNLSRLNGLWEDDRIENLSIKKGKVEIVSQPKDLTAVECKRLFTYEKETGLLFWKDREGKYDFRVASRRAPSQKVQYVALGKRFYIAAQIVWCMHKGAWPKGRIRRKNEDDEDDRIENLHVIRNLAFNPHDPIDQAKFPAEVVIDGKHIWLGAFDTKAEAEEEMALALGLDLF